MKVYALLVCLNVSCSPMTQSAPQGADDSKLKELGKKIEELEAENYRLKITIAKRDNDGDRVSKLISTALSSEYESVQVAAADDIAALGKAEFASFYSTVVEKWESFSDGFRVRFFQVVNQKEDTALRIPMIKQAIDSGASIPVRKEAIKGLHGLDDDFACDTVEKALRTNDRELLSAAILVLGDIKSTRSVKILLRLLDSEKNSVLLERIIRALGESGEASVSEKILPYLDSESTELKWAAIASLGKLGDRKNANRIAAFTGSENSDSLRQIAIVSLGRLNATDQFAAIAKIFSTESTPQTKEACVEYFKAVAAVENCEAIARIAVGESDDKQGAALMNAAYSGAGTSFLALATIWKAIQDCKSIDMKFDCAKRLMSCQEATQEQKKDAESALLSVADSLLRAQRYKDSIWAYRTVTTRSQQSVDVMFNLLNALTASENYAEAAALVDELISKCDKSTPRFIDARLAGAKVFLQVSSFDKALKAAHEILSQKDLVLSQETRKSLDDAAKAASQNLLFGLNFDDKRAASVKSLDSCFTTSAGFLLAEVNSLSSDSARQAFLDLFNKNLSTTFDIEIFKDDARLKDAVKNWKQMLEGK